jgi:hypothetical protein
VYALGLLLVGHQDHDHIGILDRVGHFLDRQAGLLGLVPGGAALAQTHGDLDAGILQVVGVSVAL